MEYVYPTAHTCPRDSLRSPTRSPRAKKAILSITYLQHQDRRIASFGVNHRKPSSFELTRWWSRVTSFGLLHYLHPPMPLLTAEGDVYFYRGSGPLSVCRLCEA